MRPPMGNLLLDNNEGTIVSFLGTSSIYVWGLVGEVQLECHFQYYVITLWNEHAICYSVIIAPSLLSKTLTD